MAEKKKSAKRKSGGSKTAPASTKTSTKKREKKLPIEGSAIHKSMVLRGEIKG